MHQLTLLGLLLFLGACSQQNSIQCTANAPINNRLSVMTYNLHIFNVATVVAAAGPLHTFLTDLVDFYLHQTGGKSVDYQDEIRLVAIANKLLTSDPAPDIVVLEELWDNNLAASLMQQVLCRYPFQYRPDSREDIFSGQLLGNGLLLLSKYPIVANTARFAHFRELSGEDAFSTKGFGSVTLQLNSNIRAGVFFTHTNALGNSATFDNISQMADSISNYQSANPDALIIATGDFNIIGDSPDYKKMMSIFNTGLSLTDAYRQLYPDSTSVPGYTYDTKSNTLIGLFALGSWQERLDYVLYTNKNPLNGVSSAAVGYSPGFGYFDPILKTTMDLSDHQPLVVDMILK